MNGSLLVDCLCAQQRRCHRCNTARMLLQRCVGCKHLYCPCCAHRVDDRLACTECMKVWIGFMTSLLLPAEVTRWVNDISL